MTLKKFNISLLPNNDYFQFYINYKFFKLFCAKKEEYFNPKINIFLEKKNKKNYITLKLHFLGSITLICDVTLNKFIFKINKIKNVNIIFSKSIKEEYENYLILPLSTRSYNIAQYIYDSIILMLPFKKIDPKIKKKYIKYGTSKKKDFFIKEKKKNS